MTPAGYMTQNYFRKFYYSHNLAPSNHKNGNIAYMARKASPHYRSNILIIYNRKIISDSAVKFTGFGGIYAKLAT